MMYLSTFYVINQEKEWVQFLLSTEKKNTCTIYWLTFIKHNTSSICGIFSKKHFKCFGINLFYHDYNYSSDYAGPLGYLPALHQLSVP